MSERKPLIHLGMIGSTGHGKATLNAAIGKVTEQRNPGPETATCKHYVAALRGTPQTVGAYAENGAKARDLLERKYGKGNILRLRFSDGDRSEQPRIPFLTENDIT